MGYLIKVQKVERPTNRSYYVNLPVVLAEAISLQKGALEHNPAVDFKYFLDMQVNLVANRQNSPGWRPPATGAPTTATNWLAGRSG